MSIFIASHVLAASLIDTHVFVLVNQTHSSLFAALQAVFASSEAPLTLNLEHDFPGSMIGLFYMIAKKITTRRKYIYMKQETGMSRVAIKTNPRLWETAKKKACTQGKLCKHSARKMQWAVNYYKKHGGKYKGKKSSSNSLRQWGKQKWRTSSGKKSGGKLRYLPDKAWKKLSSRDKRRTNSAKRKGYSKGKQYVRQPKDIARKTRKYRTLTKSKRSRKTKRSKKSKCSRETKCSKKSKRSRKTKHSKKSKRSKPKSRR